MATEITIGTSAGNKVLTELHVGTSAGNKQVTEVWIGTAAGNKQVYVGLDAISHTSWSSITVIYPSITGTNKDRTLTWTSGGTRAISLSDAGDGVDHNLQYRINSGTWTNYTSGTFNVSSGNTLGFRVTAATEDFGYTVTITDTTRGTTLNTFSVVKTGSI